jgi:NADH-quinone oxidoreductase subunit K
MISFLVLNTALFVIGLTALFVVRKNIIILLVALELLLLAINFNFIFFAVYMDDFGGQIFSMFILTVAAAESAIGLGLLVIFYRLRGILTLNSVTGLKG